MNFFLRLSYFLLFFIFCSFSNARPIFTANGTAYTEDMSITVITRKQIDNSRALTLPEMLRGVAGLDIVTNEGLGKTSALFMRGTESDHVVVFLDGIKIGSATQGNVSFEHLSLSHIERIEIVRGPSSGEAIGGVIHIFTRQSQKPTITFSSGMGVDSTYQVTAGLSGTVKNTWYSLYADHLQTKGFDDCQNNMNGGCFTIEPDDDGYDNTSYSVRLGHHFGNMFNLEAHALQAKGHTEYDSSFENEADSFQQVLGLKAEASFNNWWRMTVHGGISDDESDNWGHQLKKSFFHTHRKTFSFKNDFFISDTSTLILGYDYQKDAVSSTAYTVDNRDNNAFFAEYKIKFDTIDLIAGLREDDNEQFGKQITGNFDLAYSLNPTLRLVLSYGTAFKVPTFNDLYYPYYGNPILAPEESESFEIALKSIQKEYKWSLTAYRTKIANLITSNFDPVTDNFFAGNLNQATIKGIEYSFNWHKDGWEFNSTGSWLKPEDDSTGHLLPRRAERTAWVELAEKVGPSRLGISWLVQSHRYDDMANNYQLSGYDIWNLTGDYEFNKHWTMRFRVENLTNNQYETARFFKTQGMFWFMSLHSQY